MFWGRDSVTRMKTLRGQALAVQVPTAPKGYLAQNECSMNSFQIAEV